jgi:hypothetical protein
MSYSPLTTIGPSMGRVASLTRSFPSLMSSVNPNPSASAVVVRSAGDSSTASRMAFCPVRARWAAACRARIVLPVPLLPTTSVGAPLRDASVRDDVQARHRRLDLLDHGIGSIPHM